MITLTGYYENTKEVFKQGIESLDCVRQVCLINQYFDVANYS